MKIARVITAISGCAAVVQGSRIAEDAYVEAAVALAQAKRALPNSPHGYTPSRVDCPSEPPVVRPANSMSSNEAEWVQRRRNNTVQPLREFLVRMNVSDFDAGAYIDEHAHNASVLPNIGIAFSGGGWRALLNGAGAFKAFDDRTPNATNTGQLGGLVQASTYIAGLSGGNWLVGSIYVNNFTTVGGLQTDTSSTVWQFGNSVLEGPPTGGIQLLNTAQYYADLVDDVTAKSDAGFDVSITDIWGRALSYQLINATRGGPAYTWSSIAQTEGFQNADMPFPIVVSDARRPGQTVVSLNSSVFEFNPFEMGTWDSTTFGFVPTQYLGTNMTNGQVTPGSQCVVGFDNAGFIMGTSSSLFNEILSNVNSTDLPDSLKKLVAGIFANLGKDDNDIADYTPNPFYGWNSASNPNAGFDQLTLVDGGEDLQNIPLHPLIQPERHVDVIFAVDSSADVNNWPNATALVATYERSLNPIANGTRFPAVPDQNTFVNLGLNTHPTFFGCNASNITSSDHEDGSDVPLVVYLPNSPYVAYSNAPTFSLTTNDTYRDAIILNGYNVATMANGTVDPTWPTCVACAVLSRSFTRTGTTVPDACQQCFDRFCWNGTVDSTSPAQQYNPTTVLTAIDVTSAAPAVGPRWMGVAAAAAAGLSVVLSV